MGFDNECILNIQSLPGEYFCPVCRTLVYPNEALQSQCTHLYCKACLAYVVTTTRACPYDGYLVTEADSKPLTESNTSLAETIGKVAVHCLYYRSGCQWQGGLSESITHCAECTFGTSAVICNRCGTQIMHRQVQEHGLTCPGMQPQAQQTESQAQDSKVQGQAVAPDQSSAASAAPASVAPTAASSMVAATAVTAAPPAPSTTAGPTAGQGQIQSSAVLYPQAPVQTPTPEQWYQQQYQQYYQQYPGYDPYQQYQQYAQYQQQPQYAQQMQQVVPQQVIQGQQQQQQQQYLMPQQPQVQPQPQAQPLAQLQPHPQTQSHPHPQAQLQPQPQPHPQAQLQPHPQSQPQPQLRPQLPLQPQALPPHQLQPQAQPQLQTLVPQPQTHGQVIQHPHQYAQSQPPQQIQAPVQQLHTAQQPHPHPHAHPQSHPPPHTQFGGQQPLQPQARPHHPQPQPQHMPPQQVPHAQMQHPQFHAPQQPHPQPHSIPQHPQPHPQPQPFVQPQPQHPSAQAVSGHQSYPQPQSGQQLLPGAPQRPMQVPPQLNSQNQYPQQQTQQMRPPNAQLPMQVQQQSNALPPQGSQVSMVSGQQQAHHLVPQGQQIHQHPGMQLHAHPQGTHGQHHPGQPLQMHPQQPVHAHGQQYMQQQAPVQPTQGMQPPYHQSPATPSKPTHSAVNQQSPNKSYASPALQSGSQPSTLLEEKTKQSESTDMKISKSEIDCKSDGNREEATEERKSQKDGTLDESAEQMHEKGLETNIKDEQTKEHVLKPPVKEDASEPSGKPGQGEGTDVHKLPDGARTVQPEIIGSQGQRTENVANNMHAHSQHLQPQNHPHGPQPGSNQERKLPGPPPHPPQVFGQAPMPSQMGPPQRNNPDPFPYQGAPSIPQESFQPQFGKMPLSPYPSELPHARIAGPGLPPSSGVAPGPMGHHQNYMPPPHGLGPTNFQGQPLGHPGMGGPPSGLGGSAFAMENQMGRPHPGAPGQQAPFGHPHHMPTNGISGITPHGAPKERFGLAPEESFRPFPEQLKMHREEHFVPSTIDLKRFEEDMKRFPRPDHLDREGRHPFGPDSRPLPLNRSGGHADFGDRLRPLGHHEDLGRNHDLLRSSVGEYTDSWPGKFGLGNQSHMNDFANRERHGFGDRSKAFPLNSGGFPRSPGSGSLGYFDGPGSLRKDIDGNLTGRHIDIAEPGYGSRHGFPSETKPFNLFSHPGGMDPFEFSRVRKPGSLGLCRICKIDCETVEGLDLHSQTREHQKMAMNMVLSIKQENAKRHKLNSEGNVPFEESSRMRKPSFESHFKLGLN